jgi:septum formation protein
MIFSSPEKYKIILASRSPRRQQLLSNLGFNFDIVIRDYDEDYPESLSGKEIAIYVAKEKAKSFIGQISDNEIVITADTIVWCDNKVMGKPSGRDEAILMIRELSGNTHEVITGVTLLSLKGERSFYESTLVTFEILTDEEIAYYVDNFKPYDKAGAYGIQEWIGIAACSRIEGSYFNVVGLPVQRVYKELTDFIDNELNNK